MEINDKFEAIKTDKTNDNNKKPTLVNLSNDSTSNSSSGSLASSQTNLENIIQENTSNINKSTTSAYTEPPRYNPRPSEKEMYTSYKRTTSNPMYGASLGNHTPRRLSNIYGNQPIFSNSILYDETSDQDHIEESGSSSKGCCLECGTFAYLNKFNDLQVCDNCYQKQWQNEINDLLKMKMFLENGVLDLKRYLDAKKSQCNDNIKSSQQIKKFITMTMQQIKRKVELELENKRDELFNSIDAFVENQKKISSSINEDTFQTSERICDQIENLLLNSENDLNLMKLKSVKTFAKSYLQKLNQQRTGRVPLYSIFFVPDSTVQVNNTFGKIVLKSYDVESNDPSGANEFEDANSIRDLDNDNFNQNTEFSFLQNSAVPNHFDASQLFNKHQNRAAQYNPKWNSNENVFDTMEVLNNNGAQNRRSLNSQFVTEANSQLNKRNKSLFARSPYTNQYGTQPRLTKTNSVQNSYDINDYNTQDNYEENLSRKGQELSKQKSLDDLDDQKDSNHFKNVNEAENLASKQYTPLKVLYSQPYNARIVHPVKVTLVRNQAPKVENTSPTSTENTNSEATKTASYSSSATSSSPSSPLQHTPNQQQGLRGQKLVNF